MTLVVRASDARATADLGRHLADQGFPATLTPNGDLEVMFPGRPGIFAPAVELDLWQSRHGPIDVTVVSE